MKRSIILKKERNRTLYVWKSSLIREIIDHINQGWFSKNKGVMKTWKSKYYNGGVKENE
jgi:hypothetical protein